MPQGERRGRWRERGATLFAEKNQFSRCQKMVPRAIFGWRSWVPVSFEPKVTTARRGCACVTTSEPIEQQA